MSDYSVIRDIGMTMRHLLENNLTPLVAPENIVLESPAEIQNDSLHKLSLFLFKVEENPYLKNQETQNPDHKKIKRPPLSLDLFYLVTPFANDRSQEHLILGRVMQVFHDYAILKEHILKEGLEGSSEEFHVTLYSLPFEELFQLWQSFSEKSFRLSLCYKVTPVEVDSTREFEAKRVVEKQNRYYQKSVEKVK